MNPRDLLLHELVILVQALNRNEQAKLFLEGGRALRPLYEQWLASTESVDMTSVLDLADQFAADHLPITDSANQAGKVLIEIEQNMPWGDPVDGVSSTGAQSCWIAYDTCIRLFVEDRFVAAPGVEYLMQPVLERVSERLFGFSDVGGGPDEYRQLASIVDEPETQLAADWLIATAAGVVSAGSQVGAGSLHPLLPSD